MKSVFSVTKTGSTPRQDLSALKKFLKHGVAMTAPSTTTGRACKDFLTIVNGRPNVNDRLFTPGPEPYQKITLDELANMPFQLIFIVVKLRGNMGTLRFTGAVQEDGDMNALPEGDEFEIDFTHQREDYLVIHMEEYASTFVTAIRRAEHEEATRQETRPAAGTGVASPATPYSGGAAKGPPLVTSSGQGKFEGWGDSGRKRRRSDGDGWGEEEEVREGSGRTVTRRITAWGTATEDTRAGDELCNDNDGKDGEPVQPVVQAWSVNTLDNVPIVVQSKKDQQLKVMAIQGVVRLTSKAKWDPLIFDGVFDIAQVFAIVETARMDPTQTTSYPGFDQMANISKVCDLPIFRDAATLGAFMLGKHWHARDYSGFNMRWLEGNHEVRFDWGEAATREGKASLTAAIRRLETVMCILFHDGFRGVFAEVEELTQQQYAAVADGLIRHYFEGVMQVFFSDTAGKRRPTSIGYETWRMKTPQECSKLLKAMVGDFMRRFRPIAVGEEPRLVHLKPHADPPHTLFFAKTGLFQGTAARDTGERFGTTPAQSGCGGRQSRLASPEEALARMGTVSTMPLSPPPRKGNVMGAAPPHAPSPLAAPPGPAPTTGMCMWHVAGDMGLASRAGETYSCKIGAGCARDHTSKTPAQWGASLTKGDMREWRVSNVIKEAFGNKIPGFDKAWL
jgi:hypothetical protein